MQDQALDAPPLDLPRRFSALLRESPEHRDRLAPAALERVGSGELEPEAAAVTIAVNHHSRLGCFSAPAVLREIRRSRSDFPEMVELASILTRVGHPEADVRRDVWLGAKVKRRRGESTLLALRRWQAEHPAEPLWASAPDDFPMRPRPASSPAPPPATAGEVWLDCLVAELSGHMPGGALRPPPITKEELRRSHPVRLRRMELFQRSRALPSPWLLILEHGAGRPRPRLLTDHEAAFCISRAAADEDWRHVQRWLLESGQAGVLTPWAQAVASGDSAAVKAADRQLRRFRQRQARAAALQGK